jgi:hypothetical protein
MACCIFFSSFSILSYTISYFAPFLYKISSEASSTVSTFFYWGLLAWVFFLAEVFCGGNFLFFYVSASVGGSFGGVTLPLY